VKIGVGEIGLLERESACFVLLLRSPFIYSDSLGLVLCRSSESFEMGRTWSLFCIGQTPELQSGSLLIRHTWLPVCHAPAILIADFCLVKLSSRYSDERSSGIVAHVML
jgi:hypothetical protein